MQVLCLAALLTVFLGGLGVLGREAYICAAAALISARVCLGEWSR